MVSPKSTTNRHVDTQRSEHHCAPCIGGDMSIGQCGQRIAGLSVHVYAGVHHVVVRDRVRVSNGRLWFYDVRKKSKNDFTM